jgi:negative regulator of sigma E activity
MPQQQQQRGSAGATAAGVTPPAVAAAVSAARPCVVSAVHYSGATGPHQQQHGEVGGCQLSGVRG